MRRNFLRSGGFDFGNALVSNGTTNSVATIDNSFLNGSTKFSINFWAKGNGTSDAVALISKTIDTSNRVQIDYNQSTTNLRVFLNNGGANLTTFSGVYIGSGDMVTVTYDGSLSSTDRGKAYLNGSLLGNCPSNATSMITGGNFELQRVNTGLVFPFKGNINEVGIVDGIVFTPSEISSLYNNGNGAVLTDVISGLNGTNARYYRCNETTGATELVDEIDVTNNGTITGAIFTDWDAI